MKKQEKNTGEKTSDDSKLPEYLRYPPDEDIYKQDKKMPMNSDGAPTEEEEDENSDEGLDVPGAELDDRDERIGEEDEENNYYSIGGDEHNDLEEFDIGGGD